ncbi:MAG: MbtH family NRPS accessory protein [Candidatus Thiodiazotropha sp.]|jgi:MbtH protein
MNNDSSSPQQAESSITSEENQVTHLALINDEEQYSLWPSTKEIPLGWKTVYSGTQKSCLEYIESEWTDMRPKSVRS